MILFVRIDLAPHKLWVAWKIDFGQKDYFFVYFLKDHLDLLFLRNPVALLLEVMLL